MFNRTVGLVVAAMVTGGAALLWIAVSVDTPEAGRVLGEEMFGIWTFLYSLDTPAPRVIVAAIAVAVFFAAGLNLLEWRVTNRSRRSSNAARTPLAPKIVMAATRHVFAGPVSFTVLIPAYNEEASLPATLTSLLTQSHRPERVIVVADNCTDNTASIARSFGLEVYETQGNTQKKAGALNQVLSIILPDQGDNDIIMVLDADTTLDAGFLKSGVARFEGDRALMAIGGLFYGEPGAGLLGQMQRNEYVRYSSQLNRRRGKVFVLTGTASMFRSRALREVARNRGGSIPGTGGDVYDTHALTEDNELTIALKTLGALITSPAACTVVTEVMPTLRALWVQRLRWQRGALENIGAYGITPPTLRYWAQQLGIGYSVIALTSFLSLILITLLALDVWIWFPFWLGLGAVFMTERVVSAWNGGWPARLLAVTVVPELLFDMFLNLVYIKGIIDITRGRQGSWGPGADAQPAVAGGELPDRSQMSGAS
ncbi:MAG: glycosyltransferase family 2 protein [Cryobacterium sp.]|uniref:glycosyltransferase family 2 protein n=1 Tax=unclassified Cryobacterium TaxID=2649013 RepID=UPI0018C9A5FA|nr:MULTISPECIES: glycosyltransferase family 2 protein [unclassified Cryobacterium]MCY7404673.1 glycosyltransferase family 2 protein [Cryobacterium sp.]MEC5154968.1 cellulose synthase/poly-beta-1,6-N-acetylglucosamine synthase-like glycosyltransferase [Cryobacterium sp. CAN_C3]